VKPSANRCFYIKGLTSPPPRAKPVEPSPLARELAINYYSYQRSAFSPRQSAFLLVVIASGARRFVIASPQGVAISFNKSYPTRSPRRSAPRDDDTTKPYSSRRDAEYAEKFPSFSRKVRIGWFPPFLPWLFSRAICNIKSRMPMPQLPRPCTAFCTRYKGQIVPI
jgi:hypothetical protein